MVIFLIGNSELQKELYVKSFISEQNCEYRKIFSDEDNKLAELKNASQSLGLFSEKKAYDIVDFDEWPKKEKDEFFNLDLGRNDLTIFVRTEKLGKEAKKSVEGIKIVELEKPKEWEEDKWIDFIVSTGDKIGTPCSKETAEKIFKLTGPDEYAIISELQKLYIYSNGQLDKMTPSEIEDVIYKRTISRLDELGFSITEERFESAYKLIDELVEEYEPVLIVSSLARHFIDLLNIAVVAEKKLKFSWPEISEISKITGVQIPKTARYLGFKFKGQTNDPRNHLISYNFKYINNAIKNLYRIDREIKIGGNVRVLLYKFIEDFKSNFIDDFNNSEGGMFYNFNNEQFKEMK